jgi:hypothetical protein
MKVTDFIGRYRNASVRTKLPTNVLEGTVEEALASGDSTARKLLTSGDYAKGQ